jgi:hypothetical protein
MSLRRRLESSKLMLQELCQANNIPLQSFSISLEQLAVQYGGMKTSPGQTRFMDAIVSQAPEHAQIVAKILRGGGKTKSAAIAFAHLLRHDQTWRIFVQSGSFWQARRLYQYFLPLVTNEELFSPDWLVGEPTQYLTLFKQGGSLEVLTASAKRTRGGHVDILCIDEAVLVPQNLIDAVWPVVRTSKRPKRIIMSTASNEVNLEWFLRLWQDAPRLNFERHEWPLEECHWISKEDNANAALMLDSETYKIEYLGEIAERRGRVWDSALIDKALVDPRRAELYPQPLAPPATEWSIGLDWGFIHPTVITAWEKQGETAILRDCRIRPQTGLNDIIQEIREDFAAYPIFADSAGVHENDQMRRLGLNVTPVVFGKDKDELIGHVRWRLEKGFMKIPDPDVDSRFFTLIQQMKAYNYDERGKPRKVNDDCVDSTLCAMKPFLHPVNRGLPVTVSGR